MITRNNFYIPCFLLCGNSLTNKLVPLWAVAWQISEIRWTFCFYLMLLIHGTLMIAWAVSMLVKMYLKVVYWQTNIFAIGVEKNTSACFGSRTI